MFGIDTLEHAAVHSKHTDAIQFIQLIYTASLNDPVAKLNDVALHRLHNPPHNWLIIDDNAICFGIESYLTLEHSAICSYKAI